jgi:hypothetical protein
MPYRPADPLPGRQGPERWRHPRPDETERRDATEALVHIWSTRHRIPAVRSGFQRYVVRAVGGCDPGETGPVQNPDEDEVLR